MTRETFNQNAAIALIFDDGYRNNYEAARLLERYGFSATLAQEVRRTGFDYNNNPATPVLDATLLRSLIEDFGWEIVNHPFLDTGASEAAMAAAAEAENDLLRDILTGARVNSGGTYTGVVATDWVAGAVTHPRYSDYVVRGAVYQGGVRNAAADRAYGYVYDLRRSIPGSVAFSGDHLHRTDRLGPSGQHWSGWSIDTPACGGAIPIEDTLAFVRGLAAAGGQAIFYGHFTPDTDAGAATGIPGISIQDLEKICVLARELGVAIAPWGRVFPGNLLRDSRFAMSSGTLLAASGDSAVFDTAVTLNGGQRSVKLQWTAARGNFQSTAYVTERFAVQPFQRLIVKLRYQIGVDLDRGTSPSPNHGLVVALTTKQANTSDADGGFVDDYAFLRTMDPAYERPFEATTGFAEISYELFTGYGFEAFLTIGGLQCTGEVHIGQIVVERGESIVRLPLAGTHSFDGALGRTIALGVPNGSNERRWRWQVEARPVDLAWRTVGGARFDDGAVVVETSPAVFSIHNESGTRVDQFEWMARPVFEPS